MLGLSRLVPRKGFDVVIDAVTALDGVQLAIGGAGRDRRRLERRAEDHERVHFLGRVPDADLPALYACADVFAMCVPRSLGWPRSRRVRHRVPRSCRVWCPSGRRAQRWVTRSRGRWRDRLRRRTARRRRVRAAIGRLLGDTDTRRRMARAARTRAENEFAYEHVVARLAPLAAGQVDALEALDA